MTERHRAFVNAYLGKAAGNATKAAILAGYSEKAARQIGSRLLTYADVRQALKAKVDKQEVTVDRILAQVARIATKELTDEEIAAKDVIKASELFLDVKGALSKHQQATGAKIVVNIGFLQQSAEPSPQPVLVSATPLDET